MTKWLVLLVVLTTTFPRTHSQQHTEGRADPPRPRPVPQTGQHHHPARLISPQPPRRAATHPTGSNPQPNPIQPTEAASEAVEGCQVTPTAAQDPPTAAHTIVCDTAAAFYTLAARGSLNGSVSVHIKRVDGEVSLAALVNLSLAALALPSANLTHQCQLYPRDINTKNVFMTLVGFLLISFICIIFCYNSWPRLTHPPHDAEDGDMTPGRRYDVFVAHAYKDNELVQDVLIAPLINLGYSVAWHNNVFKPGDWVIASVEKAMSNSRRMIVLATENLANSRWVNLEIRRARHEECDVRGFKITALVMDTLPRVISRDLYDIVAVRTHVVHRNCDYLKKLREFLPEPRVRPNTDSSYTHKNFEDDLRLLKELRQWKRQQQHVSVTEVFGIHRENSHISLNLETARNDEMTDDQCRMVIKRFKQRPLLDPFSQSHTISTDYVVENCGNDDEEVAQIEGFVKNVPGRKSCKW